MIFLEILAIAVGVIIALTLMVVGLVEAPWPVLLVLLLAGWYSLQRLSIQNEALVNSASKPIVREDAGAESAEQQSTSFSKFVAKQIAVRSQNQAAPVADQETESGLKYRGVSYQPDSTEPQSSETTVHQPDQETASFRGKYRGRNWKRPTVSSTDSQPHLQVRYRGHKVASSNDAHDSKQ